MPTDSASYACHLASFVPQPCFANLAWLTISPTIPLNASLFVPQVLTDKLQPAKTVRQRARPAVRLAQTAPVASQDNICTVSSATPLVLSIPTPILEIVPPAWLHVPPVSTARSPAAPAKPAIFSSTLHASLPVHLQDMSSSTVAVWPVLTSASPALHRPPVEPASLAISFIRAVA